VKHKFQYEYNNEDEEGEVEETIAVFHSCPGKTNNTPTVPKFHQILAAAASIQSMASKLEVHLQEPK
jgi:hypothetical protein